jgi:hypothetical protein
MCRAAAFRLAVRQSGDLLDEFGLSVGDGGVTQRDKGIRASPKNAPGLPNCGTPPRGAPTAPRTVRSAWGAAPRSSIPAERSAACDPSHEHQILRRDRHRGHATAPRIVEPVDGHALGRRRKPISWTKALGPRRAARLLRLEFLRNRPPSNDEVEGMPLEQNGACPDLQLAQSTEISWHRLRGL